MSYILDSFVFNFDSLYLNSFFKNELLFFWGTHRNFLFTKCKNVNSFSCSRDELAAKMPENRIFGPKAFLNVEKLPNLSWILVYDTSKAPLEIIFVFLCSDIVVKVVL